MNIEVKMNDVKYTGAGIICYIDNRNGVIEDREKDFLFLILENKSGKYDYPKGGIDYNEDILKCAKREANEEANIKDSDIEEFIVDDLDKAFISSGCLVLFLAKLKNYSIGNIKINFNPVINDYEHENFHFLTKEQAENNMLFYLNNSLDWAYNIIKNQ